MGSAVMWPVPGAGGGRTAMPKRIRQWIVDRQWTVVVLPVFLALFTDFARRWW